MRSDTHIFKYFKCDILDPIPLSGKYFFLQYNISQYFKIKPFHLKKKQNYFVSKHHFKCSISFGTKLN